MFETIWISTKWNVKNIDPITKSIDFLLKCWKKIYLSKHANETLKWTKYLKLDSIDYSKKIDLIIIFGWDWSILRMNRNLNFYDTKILWINMWKLWFLSAVWPNNMVKNLKWILDWNYRLDERSLLEISVTRWKKKIISWTALNEAVISYKDISRLIFIKAKMDNSVMANYAADWLIIATPTWSTAYNISAGWPIVCPRIPAFILTPICSHSFTQKPVVIWDFRSLSFELTRENKEDFSLTLDGQVVYTIKVWDVISVKKAKETFKFIRLPWERFHKTLKSKLHWG